MKNNYTDSLSFIIFFISIHLYIDFISTRWIHYPLPSYSSTLQQGKLLNKQTQTLSHLFSKSTTNYASHALLSFPANNVANFAVILCLITSPFVEEEINAVLPLSMMQAIVELQYDYNPTWIIVQKERKIWIQLIDF